MLFCSSDTEFSITLNGKDALTEDEKTLASYGIVPGDLICLLLEETDAKSNLPPPSSSSPPSLQNGRETSTLTPKNQADGPKEERQNEQSDNQKAQVEAQKSDSRVSTWQLACMTQDKKWGILYQMMHCITKSLFRIFDSLWLSDNVATYWDGNLSPALLVMSQFRQVPRDVLHFHRIACFLLEHALRLRKLWVLAPSVMPWKQLLDVPHKGSKYWNTTHKWSAWFLSHGYNSSLWFRWPAWNERSVCLVHEVRQCWGSSCLVLQKGAFVWTHTPVSS